MQIDFISDVAFLRPLHVTKAVIWDRDMRIRGKCQTEERLYYGQRVVYSDHRLLEHESSECHDDYLRGRCCAFDLLECTRATRYGPEQREYATKKKKKEPRSATSHENVDTRI